jgi:hypothetical protein
MAERIGATLSIIAGGFASIMQLLVAFGVNISPDQHTAIGAVIGLMLLISGIWLHPDIPVGIEKPTTEPPPAAPRARRK